MTAGISHEVQNPNTAISMNLQVMRKMLDRIPPDAGLPDFRSELDILLRETLDASNRIAALTASLNRFASPNTEEFVPGVDLNVIVEQAARWVRHRIKAIGATFSFRLSASCPSIEGNPQQLEQLFVNLFDNACNAIDRAGTVIEVVTKPDAAGHAVVVTITDQGVGIAPQDLDRVFDPFYTTRRASGGSGLGLSISAAIAKSHGGAIDIASSQGKGAKVTVTLARYRKVVNAAV